MVMIMNVQFKYQVAAIGDFIWFGIDKPKLTIFKDESLAQYMETELPSNWRVDSRMQTGDLS